MMPMPTNVQKKRISVYIIAAVLAWIISMIPLEILPVYSLSALLYITIMLGWALSLYRRIVHPVIRRLLVTSAILMASLFYLRICRYNFFVSLPYIRQYFWYLYYVPFTGVPLFAFFASLAVDTPEDVLTIIMAGAKNDINENPHHENPHHESSHHENSRHKKLRHKNPHHKNLRHKNPHHEKLHHEDSHYVNPYYKLYVGAVIVLTVLWILLCIAIMTNAFHGQVFHIKDAAYEKYSYGMLYIMVVIWETVFAIAAFSVMTRKCRISAMRDYWYIPVIPSATAAALMIIYIIAGGSPTLFGIRLYKIQEAFCLLYVGLFEGSIAIGFIPSNSGYEELFGLSHINAAIVDSEGVLVYRSHNYTEKHEFENCLDDDVRKGTDRNFAADELQGTPVVSPIEDDNDRNYAADERSKDAYIRCCEKNISGGKILWVEDLSGIAKINEDIRIATEQIEEENDLIEQENRIAVERAVYEAKNRLYDKIAGMVSPQVDEIERELACSESQFYHHLKHSVVLASYIKRRGNLILIADGHPLISTDELALAIRESCEYLELSEKYAKLDVTGETKISSELILYAYDMFEEIIEDTWHELLTLFVKLEVKQTFTMQVAVALKRDGCKGSNQYPAVSKSDRCKESDKILSASRSDKCKVIDKDWNREELAVLGAGIVIDYSDDTWYVTMHTGEEVRKC